MAIRAKLDRLIDTLACFEEVIAIGRTGNSEEIPKAGKGDIDLFVICDSIPLYSAREDKYAPLLQDGTANSCAMQVCQGGIWGTGDVFDVCGVDTMPMYFTAVETEAYISNVLAGNALEREGDFYPIGRCATFASIGILYDRTGFLDALKDRLAKYPDDLSTKCTNITLAACSIEKGCLVR